MFISTFNFKCLKISTHLGTIKTNGFIGLSKYPIKYLELVIVSIDFEIAISSTLTSQNFIGFFAANFSFVNFVSPSLNLILL